MTDHFKQPRITGYRQLDEADVALINEIKAEGERVRELAARVRDRADAQQRASEGDAPEAADLRIRLANAQPQRWAAIGATHLQEGLMALVRAVAQPTSF